jgi:hypothetical protein
LNYTFCSKFQVSVIQLFIGIVHSMGMVPFV